MSVSLIISNPITENEDCYYVPIATEEVFQIFWMPIIEKLELKWSCYFQCGVEINKASLKFVLKELAEINDYVFKNMDNIERKIQMLGRIQNLCHELEYIYKNSREDIKVYIG